MDLSSLQSLLSGLRPLGEDNVDRYESVVASVADVGTAEAARCLLLELDDACNLAGVMQTVTGLVSEFPPAILVPVLLAEFPGVSSRAGTTVQDVLRSLLQSVEGRAELLRRAVASSNETRAALRPVLVRIGRFPRYHEATLELLRVLE